MLVTAFRAGGTLLICGNGGSAADAQHLATEFVSTLTLDHRRPAMRAIALTTDTSALTAIANDFGAERMFARQVEAFGATRRRAAGDLDERQLARTCSPPAGGGARDRLSRDRAHRSLGWRRSPRWPMSRSACPSTATGHIQECHLAIEQLLALLAERELYPATP